MGLGKLANMREEICQRHFHQLSNLYVLDFTAQNTSVFIGREYVGLFIKCDYNTDKETMNNEQWIQEEIN